jgi:hypothetical protein
MQTFDLMDFDTWLFLRSHAQRDPLGRFPLAYEQAAEAVGRYPETIHEDW